MILQALTRLYEDMADRGDIARQGWGPGKDKLRSLYRRRRKTDADIAAD